MGVTGRDQNGTYDIKYLKGYSESFSAKIFKFFENSITHPIKLTSGEQFCRTFFPKNLIILDTENRQY